MWFNKAEAQFHIHQIIPDPTKYYYVVSITDQDTAGHLVDFLHQPPTNKYKGIKTLLKNVSGLSHSDWAAKLLPMDGTGDHKPNELINEMLTLIIGHKTCLLFQKIFVVQMPEDICLLLADDNFADP